MIIDEGVRKRHKHETIKGRDTRFVVQLGIRVHDKWKVAVRYDCAHGYAHSDQYDINGNHNKKKMHLTFESALTYGDWDINENWQNYLKAFLRGIKYDGLVKTIFSHKGTKNTKNNSYNINMLTL